MGELIINLSDKTFGDMSRRFGGEVAQNNRQRYTHEKGLEGYSFYHMDTEHRDNVTEIDVGNTSQDPPIAETDAIILSGDIQLLQRSAIVLIAADCIPMGISSHSTASFGLAHLGWKSLNLHLAEKFIKRYVEINNVSTGEIIITIGPSIRKESYIYPAPIEVANDSWKPFIAPVDEEHESLDPIGYLNACLAKVGIAQDQIFDCGEDTAASNSPYFSHYRATKEHTPDARGMCITYLAQN